jgi:pimeloyl-ACP methyl ester carboxylesterase
VRSLEIARSKHAELAYSVEGSGDETVLLVMGLGGRAADWGTAFPAALAKQYRVVRFDNRGVGKSPKAALGYSLSDLAGDAVAVLDAVGAALAHVIGISMGGMIAQQLVIDHPRRVRSLCSIMSTTGDRAVGQPAQETLPFLFAPPAANRAEAIDRGQKLYETIGSPGYPADTAELRQSIADAYDRSYRPAGTLRQLAAIIASPDRTPGLAATTVPAAVIHGDSDRLVDVSGGYATAAALPDTEPLIIKGMGHDLPAALWPTLVDAIVANARRAVS